MSSVEWDITTHKIERKQMPYVNIKLTDEAVTQKQKEELITDVTLLLQNVLNKTPKTTVVVIDEINVDNWGIEGETVTNSIYAQSILNSLKTNSKLLPFYIG